MKNYQVVRQISIFLENKAGRLYEVTRTLSTNNLNIYALNISESGDFGMVRLIVQDYEKASVALKEAGFAVIKTDVILMDFANEAGSLSKILNQLAENGISLEYMYAMQHENKSYAVVRPKNIDDCIKVLESNFKA